MNKLAALLATTAAIAFANSASAAEVKTEAHMERTENGGYEKSVSAEKTNAAGTKSTTETEVDYEVDDDGDRTRTTTTKQTHDPEGLWNKDTVKTKTTEKMRDGKLTVETEKTINGETVKDRKSTY